MKGFLRVSAAVPVCSVAACDANAAAVEALWAEADAAGSAVVVFPELCVTGYTARDLFQSRALLDAAAAALARLAAASAGRRALALVGVPLATAHGVFNVAAAVQGGRVRALVPKSYLPNYREFEERRWFRPARDLPPGATVTLHTSADGADGADGGEAYEVPIGTDIVLEDARLPGACVGAEVCEDMWVPCPPSARAVAAGATLVCNLSASSFVVGKAEERRLLARATSARGLCAYAYVAAGPGESSTDVTFDADAFVAENGAVLAESTRFSRRAQLVTTDIDVDALLHERRVCTTFGDCAAALAAADSRGSSPVRRVPVQLAWAAGAPRRTIARHPFVPADGAALATRAWETFEIQTNALATRMRAIAGGSGSGSSSSSSVPRLVLGLSGGLDSTHAALVAAAALDALGAPRRTLLCVTMPGLGTSATTRGNAAALAESLGAELRTVPISEAARVVLDAMGHPCAAGAASAAELVARVRAAPALGDASLENVQARLRTLLLMCIANRERGLVVGTGDLSEKALGWCTYAGDHIAMYDVNAGVPKTLIQFLIRWVAAERAAAWAATSDVARLRATLAAILATPISPSSSRPTRPAPSPSSPRTPSAPTSSTTSSSTTSSATAAPPPPSSTSPAPPLATPTRSPPSRSTSSSSSPASLPTSSSAAAPPTDPRSSPSPSPRAATGACPPTP